eukprot:6205327-Pleurochrysis_carterae.AAC.2
MQSHGCCDAAWKVTRPRKCASHSCSTILAEFMAKPDPARHVLFRMKLLVQSWLEKSVCRTVTSLRVRNDPSLAHAKSISASSIQRQALPSASRRDNRRVCLCTDVTKG